MSSRNQRALVSKESGNTEAVSLKVTVQSPELILIKYPQ